MAFPMLPLLLLGGGLAALLATSSASAAKPAPPPPPPPVPVPPGWQTVDPSFRTPPSPVKPGTQTPTQPAVIAVDPNMPAAAVAELQRILSVTTDPDKLEAIAVLLEQQGYLIAAATVRAYAAALRARGAGSVVAKIETVISQPPAPPAPASFAYQIRNTTEVPYILAKRYTGDAARWREILPLNPNMVVRQKKSADGKITTLVEPWYVGLRVNLPGSWLAQAMASRTAA